MEETCLRWFISLKQKPRNAPWQRCVVKKMPMSQERREYQNDSKLKLLEITLF